MVVLSSRHLLESFVTLSLLQSVATAGHIHRHLHSPTHSHSHHHEAIVRRQTTSVDVAGLIDGIGGIEQAMGNPSLSNSFITWLQGVASRIKSIDLVVVLGPSATSSPSLTSPATVSASASPTSSVATSPALSSTPATVIPATTSSSITVSSSAGASISTSKSATTMITSSSSPTSTTIQSVGSYNPKASNNVVVYYGQTPNTKSDGSDLLHICQDPNVSIVNMAFIYEYFATNNFPATNFGPACWAAKNSIAPDVYDCSPYATAIQTCQSSGKKVFISIGGAVGESSFPSLAQAETFASNLWNMFGNPAYTDDTFQYNGATYNWTDFRPFGSDIIIDGVDVDNENNNPSYYTDFAVALRQNYARDTSGRKYYLSSAPQCFYPDASNPVAMLLNCDLVNIQFYDNPGCNINAANNGFTDSVLQWSEILANSTYKGASGVGPQLMIGVPALNNVGSGYVPAAQLKGYIDQVKALDIDNFGGIMMWDGTEALNNVVDGANFLDVAAAAVQ